MTISSEYISLSKNKQSYFFEKPAHKIKHFPLPKFPENSWQYQITDDWIYLISKEENNPLDQGWKIHITADAKDAALELYEVAKFLISKNISFKFVPNVNKLISKNSKYANRSSSGKFITVYPHDTNQFLRLLDELAVITKDFASGPYILNDKQWKNSNVFFRYGGFKQMLLKQNGKLVPAIKDPSGNLVPDQRVPYYYLPPFIDEPTELANGVFTPSNDEFIEFGKFDIQNVIHFSNAGGVYKAKFDNKNYILKEGRPKAGLDAAGLDGFDRVKNEYHILKKLENIDSVVKPFRYFTAWKHNYLAEEFIEGVSLDTFIAEQFPFMSKNKETLEVYKNTCIDIIKQLVAAIRNVHKEGIAVGDLQPSNVVYSSKLKSITLIDFESANLTNAEYNPGLMTPGFVSSNSKTYEEADWYAVQQIAYYLFMPIESTINNLSFEIMKVFNKHIAETFGIDAINFLEEVQLEVSRHAHIYSAPLFLNDSLRLPQKEINISTINETIDGLSKGIINNWDPNSRGLIKGDPRQFKNEVSQYSIAYGAFGGIMALHRAGKLTNIALTDVNIWLANNLPLLEKLCQSKNSITTLEGGLFTGIAGICSVLYDINQESLATKLLNNIEIDSQTSDMSIYSGITGIGFACLAGYILTKDKDLLTKSLSVAELIEKSFTARKSKAVVHTNAGLLDGLTGEALFLLKLGRTLHKSKYINLGIELLDYVFQNQLNFNNNGQLLIADDSKGFQRFIPYLNSGVAGLASTIIIFGQALPDYLTEERLNILNSLIQSNAAYCSVQGSIIDGYAGFLVLGNLVEKFNGNSKLKKYNLNALNLYLLAKDDNEILMPGRSGLKCSMDFETGASGMLLALLGTNHFDLNKWVPLPLKVLNELW